MHGDVCSDTVGRNQDREVVTGTREPDDFVAQHVSPEGGGTIHVSAPKTIVPRRSTTRLLRSREFGAFLGPHAGRRTVARPRLSLVQTLRARPECSHRMPPRERDEPRENGMIASSTCGVWLLGVSKHAAQDEQQNDHDQLAHEDDAVHVVAGCRRHRFPRSRTPRLAWRQVRTRHRSGPASFAVGVVPSPPPPPAPPRIDAARDHGDAVAFVRVPNTRLTVSVSRACCITSFGSIIDLLGSLTTMSFRATTRRSESACLTAEDSVCSDRDRWFDGSHPDGRRKKRDTGIIRRDDRPTVPGGTGH